jgi:hypothetical protein
VHLVPLHFGCHPAAQRRDLLLPLSFDVVFFGRHSERSEEPLYFSESVTNAHCASGAATILYPRKIPQTC